MQDNRLRNASSTSEPYRTQDNLCKSYMLSTMFKTQTEGWKRNYQQSPAEFDSFVTPKATNYWEEVGRVGWRANQQHRTAHKIISCPKNVLKEWDRYSSEVYVYGPGKQPVDIDKKYRVNMSMYKIGRPKKANHILTDATKQKILDVPITSHDLRAQRLMLKHPNSSMDKKINFTPGKSILSEIGSQDLMMTGRASGDGRDTWYGWNTQFEKLKLSG